MQLWALFHSCKDEDSLSQTYLACFFIVELTFLNNPLYVKVHFNNIQDK